LLYCCAEGLADDANFFTAVLKVLVMMVGHTFKGRPPRSSATMRSSQKAVDVGAECLLQFTLLLYRRA
jgi:hypothetical protein